LPSAAAARQWWLDVNAGKLCARVREGGTPHVLLKGPSLAAALYPREIRQSYDVDLLIREVDLPHMREDLVSQGFERRFSEDDDARGVQLQGEKWIRDKDGLIVDVHTSLAELRCRPETAWTVLSAATKEIDVGGFRTKVLRTDALALHVALHAAHHGPSRSWPVEDLRRALEAFSRADWQAAAELARALDASAAFGAGLRLVDEGARLAQALGLPDERSRERSLRWQEAPWGARVLDHLAAERGLRKRLGVVLRVLAPTPNAMRLGTPLARRGRRGLVFSYAVRPLRLIWRLPGAVASLRSLHPHGEAHEFLDGGGTGRRTGGDPAVRSDQDG
jgi:hypothetical protein